MRTALVIVVCLVNLVLLAGFYFHAPSFTVKNRIEDNLGKYASRQVNLSEAYPARWDRVCIFAHGIPPAEIDSTLGRSWYAPYKTNIVSNEEISLLVFLREGRVINHVQFPRARADFSAAASRGCFSRSNALFRMDEGNGLVPAATMRPETGP